MLEAEAYARDFILNGDMCQYCYILLTGNGHPQTCPACEADQADEIRRAKSEEEKENG